MCRFDRRIGPGEDLYATVEQIVDVPPTASSEVPAFDADAALAQVGGSAEMLEELVGMFDEEAPKLVANVLQAIEAGDAERVRTAAHGLKGSLSVFAAPAAVAAARSLEELGQGGDLTGVEALQADLENEMGRLQQALARFAAEGGSSGASRD